MYSSTVGEGELQESKWLQGACCRCEVRCCSLGTVACGVYIYIYIYRHAASSEAGEMARGFRGNK